MCVCNVNIYIYIQMYVYTHTHLTRRWLQSRWLVATSTTFARNVRVMSHAWLWWVMSHIWMACMSHVTRMNDMRVWMTWGSRVTHMWHDSCMPFICETWLITIMRVTWGYEWHEEVVSHTWIYDIRQECTSHVTRIISKSHVTWINGNRETCHTHESTLFARIV